MKLNFFLINEIYFCSVFKEPTVITKHPEDVELLEGENAELKCAADHDPEFDISWVWDQDKKPIQGLLPNYDVQGSLLKVRETLLLLIFL